MADRLKRAAMSHARFCAIFCALCLMHGAANAQINDPTQPPPGYATPAPAGQALSAPAEAPLQVSSLFLMGAKSWAIIDDQIVRRGDPIAGGKVAKIDANGVWIAVAGQGKARTSLRLLKLLPEVVKTPPKVGMEKK
jgi:hypothetical protein